MSLFAILVFCLIWGAITAAIGQNKNLPVGECFALGALLGLIGVVIMIVRSPQLPKPPDGMCAVKCRRCNTVQNISLSQVRHECWQCKQLISRLANRRVEA